MFKHLFWLCPFWLQCWLSPAALSFVPLTFLIPRSAGEGPACSSGQPQGMKTALHLGKPMPRSIISHGIMVINYYYHRLQLWPEQTDAEQSAELHYMHSKDTFLMRVLQEAQLPTETSEFPFWPLDNSGLLCTWHLWKCGFPHAR